MRIRVLSGQDIDRALSMTEAIEVNAGAYRAVSTGDAVMPQRARLETPEGPLLLMPALLGREEALVVKVVSVFMGNVKRDIPAIHALILVLDSRTGEPRALLNGERLTAKRTGAGVGAATRALARQDAQVMALIGAGAQAADQVRAVLAVRPIREVRIFSKMGRSARDLAVRLGLEIQGVRLWAPKTIEKTVAGADVITAVTNSSEPVFDAALVSPGAHINGVGAFSREMHELPLVDLPMKRVFVDSRKAARAEAGDVIQALEEMTIKTDDLVEIGEVLTGAATGRRNDREITVFKSVGLAAQDAATARAILLKAEELGLGSAIDL